MPDMPEDTVDELAQHIPEHKGHFRRIVGTKDKVVFFFAFERSEMKPASHARHEDFSLVCQPIEGAGFPEGNPHRLNISMVVTVLGVAPAEATAALATTVAETKEASDKLARALSGTVTCSEELLQEIKALTDRTMESMTQLQDTLCDTVAIPEILTTSVLEATLKKCLEPAAFVVSREGGGGGHGLFSPAATSREDLRIYHKKFVWKGKIQGASIILGGGARDADSDADSDTDNLIAGSAFELKPSAGQTFNHYQPQLLRNMERVATDLAYKAVRENEKYLRKLSSMEGSSV